MMLYSPEKYTLSLVFLCICFTSCDVVSSTNSFPGAIYTRVNSRLKGHTFKSFVARSQISCSHGCLSNTRCYSTNFRVAFHPSHPTGLCEFNYDEMVDRLTLENELHHEEGFVYTRYPRGSLDGGCRWNGCQNKGVCTLQENAYTCVCELPWTGTFCETKILLYNFTTLGATGSNGPDSNVGYSGTGLQRVSVADGVQEWNVPITAKFNVEACGASGGDGISSHKGLGGRGAKVRGELRLAKGQRLKIIVGQRGLTKDGTNHGSGGGGTFVLNTTNLPILVAGGGGGGGQLDGLHGNDKTEGSGNASSSNGTGGLVCRSNNQYAGRPTSGSGAGFYGKGGCLKDQPICGNSECDEGGKSLRDNFKGGHNKSKSNCDGGFGGGGACDDFPGGGGGYSGGGVTDNRQAGGDLSWHGGGGGSYIPVHDSTWNAIKGGCKEGDGYVSFLIAD